MMRNSRRALAAAALALPLGLGACQTTATTTSSAAPSPAPQAAAGAGPHKEILTPGSALFSTAVRSGGMIYLSGVIGRSADGDAGAATRQALQGVQSRLEAVGHSMADAVKCTVYMIDMDDYGAMNQVYTEFFPENPPARTAIAVRALPANAQVEVTCIAAAR